MYGTNSAPLVIVVDPLTLVQPVNAVADFPVYWITDPSLVNRYPLDGKYVVSCTVIDAGIDPLEDVMATGFWIEGGSKLNLAPALV